MNWELVLYLALAGVLALACKVSIEFGNKDGSSDD